jgi:hypothetical protein
MIAGLLNRAWRLACLPAARRFERSLGDPGTAQRARLSALLRRHARSAFGRAHGFASIEGPEAFRERVPLQRWDDVAPWIERIRRGEPTALTADPVERLVPTGGSSGGAKLIPWTRGLAREFHAALAPWLVDLQRRHPGVRGGPAYWSISPAADQRHDGAVPIGFDDDSAYLGGALARLVRPLLAAPAALRGIIDVDAFRYATLRCLLARRELRLISVWHPSFLGLLLDEAMHERERLIADLARGELSVAVPDGVRRALAPWLNADPRRAAELDATDWSDARALWPRLALVSCWGDAAAELPMRALARRLRGVPVQAKGLLATEGALSIPWRGQTVAAVTSHVLEFIDGAGRARWIDELAEGEAYEVAITTGGGLWRYRLGDRVRVTGLVERTPCLRFIGRVGAVCDLVGEKLDEGFVATALAEAMPAARFALLAPNGDGSAGYTLFSDAIAPDALERLDASLAANPQWRWARSLGQIAPLRAAAVSAAEAERAWLEHRRAACLGTVKPAALDADRGWAERFGVAEAACSR